MGGTEKSRASCEGPLTRFGSPLQARIPEYTFLMGMRNGRHQRRMQAIWGASKRTRHKNSSNTCVFMCVSTSMYVFSLFFVESWAVRAKHITDISRKHTRLSSEDWSQSCARPSFPLRSLQSRERVQKLQNRTRVLTVLPRDPFCLELLQPSPFSIGIHNLLSMSAGLSVPVPTLLRTTQPGTLEMSFAPLEDRAHWRGVRPI